MNWEEVEIGVVANVVPGFAFESAHLGEEGTPVIKIGNITNNGEVNLVDAQKLPDNHLEAKHERFRLANRDILLAMTGATAGKVGRISAPDGSTFLLNQRVAKIEPNTVDPDFFWYVISTKAYRERFFGLGGGAAQPNMSGPQIAAIKIPLPPNKIQQKIAGVLSSYDDLIKNSQRRIALLEEAARLLYREWFVHYRFPGHERVKIVDGIPEGWEQRTLGSVLNLQRGFDLPVNNRVAGKVPVYGATGIVDEHNVIKVTFPTLITGRSGSLGRVCFVDGPCWPLNTSLWVTNFKAVSIYLAYFILSEMDLAKFNAGTSVPTLDRKVVHAANVLVPTRSIATQFDEQMEVLFTQKKLLNQQIQKLAQARDLLLPRLMNGQITV